MKSNPNPFLVDSIYSIRKYTVVGKSFPANFP